MTLRYSDLLQANRLSELKTLLNSGAGGVGHLHVYAGSVPPSVDRAITDQTLLFTSSADATTCLDPVQGDTSTPTTMQFLPFQDATAAAGTAAFFRLAAASGTAYAQGLCATSGAELNFTNPVFAANDVIQIAGTGDLTLTAGND